MTPRELIQFIERRRLPLTREKTAQDELEAEFLKSGIAFEREVHLDAGDIVDFMLEGVALEMKIRGQRREIYRQCERYCKHDRVQSLVLATNAAMGMPPQINGKPVAIARLGFAWL